MDRVVIVTKPTRLDDLVRQHLTEGAARFALESREQPIAPYVREDAIYKAALAQIRRQIPGDLPIAAVSREELPNFLFREKDLVVVCGPDGLFVNLAKYLDAQPVLAINPDPATIGGALMRFPPQLAGVMVERALAGKHRTEPLPFVKATIDDERIEWGVNDIFVGRRDQVSARYEIAFDGKSERQSSSGVIVSTGVGSTGWMSSIVAMSRGLGADGKTSPLSTLPQPASAELVFVVREPFPAPGVGADLVTGRVVPGRPLRLISEMPSGGCVFSDGVVERTLDWSAGSTVEITVGERYLRRIVG
jgi:NAD kinase